jgi:hypothetical protein
MEVLTAEQKIAKLAGEITDLLVDHKKKLENLTDGYKSTEWTVYENLRIMENIVAKAAESKTTEPKKTSLSSSIRCKTLLGAINHLHIPEDICKQHITWCMENREIFDVEREYVSDGKKYILTNKIDGALQYYVQKTVIG